MEIMSYSMGGSPCGSEGGQACDRQGVCGSAGKEIDSQEKSDANRHSALVLYYVSTLQVFFESPPFFISVLIPTTLQSWTAS